MTKPKKKLRDDAIRVRISSEERAAFTAAAEQESLTVSAWLRSVASRWLKQAGTDK